MPAMKRPGKPKKATPAKRAKTKSATAKKPAARAAKKNASTARRTSKAAGPAKRTPETPAGRAMVARRADYGAPIDGFFAKQPPHLRAILEALRALVEAEAPDAVAGLKWGMPVYTLSGSMMCALGGHQSHVNLVLAGPPNSFADPGGRLEGAGKTGRHLTMRSLDDLPRDAVRGWLRTAVKVARAKA
jgi:hypothetical protein